MTTWKTSLIFDDRVNDRRAKLKLSFPPLYRYTDIYNTLENLVQMIGWDPIKYLPNCITFKLVSYMETPLRVADWNKFILNRDKIKIIIFDPSKFYYALYTERGEKLIQTGKMQTIYNDIQIEYVREPLLLYKINDSGTKIQLIDVIDNPKRHYNNLVNRMIKQYNY